MKLRQSLVRVVTALALLVALLVQGTWALAGTTGSLSGTVVDTTNKPVKGAKVSAVSPSQISNTTTDANGQFSFLALAPDTYNVSVEAPGFDAVTQSGITVFADQSRSLPITLGKLKEIVRVQSRSATSLVRPGTTADVYAVDATQQSAVAGVGGGVSLNTAYSAIATVPGVYVPQGVQGGNGIGSNVYIRGGDYDQVGFEIDGVPVNRSFDNYPSGPGASLGQSQLEVYTGAAPANAEGQGLAGFINQVIRVGTFPGFVTGDLGIGGPSYYHKAGLEIGGATPDRNFTYYVGVDGYNQDLRYVDQFNGSGIGRLYGQAIGACPNLPLAVLPSCVAPGGANNYGFDAAGNQNVFLPGLGNGSYAFVNPSTYLQAGVAVRDNVFNVHVALPHKNGLKDDVQLLYTDNFVSTHYYNSTNDQGGPLALSAALSAANGAVNVTQNADGSFSQSFGIPAPYYVNGYNYNGPTGTALPANFTSMVSPYYYPRLQTPGTFNAATAIGNSTQYNFIDPNAQDAISNDQAIFKLQYTHNFSSSALVKLYGYTYYSDWLQIGPNSGYTGFYGINAGESPDYELSSHTRGVSATFSDQLNSQNLLQFQGSYTTANSLRDNNTQFYNGLSSVGSKPSSRNALAVLVDSTNPTGGLCYDLTGAPRTCAFGNTPGKNAQFITLPQAYAGTFKAIPAGLTCGGGPCEYYVIGNGQYATYNTVTPRFISGSLTDQFKPSSRLSIDLGLRLDHYEFQGQDTTGTGARTLYYNAYNRDNCVNNTTSAIVARAPDATCPGGTSPANFVNPSGNVTEVYNEYQPRIGLTYSLNPTTVVRASYGRFSQAPNSAFEQYNTLQPDAPAQLYGTYGFQAFGFNSPNHQVRPEVSNNYDLSVEHSFAGDTSIKLSPFYRKTQDQIQQFYLNQATGFVSGLNVGKQTSEGFELEIDKGNFGRDGIAAKLSFTYTNSFVNYQRLANGSSVIDPFNQAVQAYNAYTSACAPGGKYAGTNLCGTTQNGGVAAPCYTTAGAAITTAAGCVAGTVANPYYNAPAQGLFDPNGNYPTFDILPAGIGTAVQGYGAPFVVTFITQYKKNKFAFTPNVQFEAGQRYGAPLSTYGVAPDMCTGTTGPAAGDARYNYGSVGSASGFDASTCGTLAGIPDPYTRAFDGIGGFVGPSSLQFGSQFSYEATKNVTFVATLANIVNTCFGGTKTGFAVSGACNYGVLGAGTGGDVGNVYNPGAAIQPYINTPYLPQFAGYPFSAYFSAKIKL